MKPEASTDLQRGSRAAHFKAKAKSIGQKSREESLKDSSGVGGAASVEGMNCNSGDPSHPPSSRQDVLYKQKVKAEVDERESEGIIVPKSEAKAFPLCQESCRARINSKVKRNYSAPTGQRQERPSGHRRRLRSAAHLQ